MIHVGIDLHSRNMTLVAIIAYRDYPVVKALYKKVTRRSGKHVARTVVGKELAKIVWHMLTKTKRTKDLKERRLGLLPKLTGHSP